MRLNFFCARKALRHHCIAYVWCDEMWNQRTGQCRYRAMCVFLCASLRWHLIVMNFKAGSRGSDSIGQFMKTVGGIVLYMYVQTALNHTVGSEGLGLNGSVFSLCSQCGVCFYVCVIKAVVMKLHPLSARPAFTQLLWAFSKKKTTTLVLKFPHCKYSLLFRLIERGACPLN